MIKFSKHPYSSGEVLSYETKPYKLHRLEEGPSTKVSVGKEEALHLYNQLNTIRRLEAASGSLYKEKIIRGFCHLYSGQVEKKCNVSTPIYISNIF